MPIPDRDIATLLDDALVERDSDMDEAWRTVESRAARSRNRRRVVAAVAGVLTVIGIAGIVEWRHTDRTTVTVAPTPTTDLAALPGTLGQLISDRIVSPSSGDPVTLPLQLLDGTSATFTVPSDVYAELKGYRVVARAALICTPGCGFTELAAEPGAGTLVGTEIGQLPGAEGTSVAVVDRGWTKALVFRTTHWTIQANTFNMPETNFGQWAEALRFNEGPDGWPVLSTPPGFSLYPNPGYFPGIELYGAAGSLTVKTNACDGSQPPENFSYSDGTQYAFGTRCVPGIGSITGDGQPDRVGHWYDTSSLTR
jgi:hypothetical protein